MKQMKQMKHHDSHLFWSYSHKNNSINDKNGCISHKIIQKVLKHASSCFQPASKLPKNAVNFGWQVGFVERFDKPIQG
jgi:hypothetical protein